MSSPFIHPSSSSLVGGTSILFAPNPPTLPNQATSVDGRLELEAAYAPPSPLQNVSLFRRRYPLRPYGLPLPFTTPTRCASAPPLLVVAPHPRRPHDNPVDLLEGSLRRFSLSDADDRPDIQKVPSIVPHTRSPTISAQSFSTRIEPPRPNSNRNIGVRLRSKELKGLSTLIVDVGEGKSLNWLAAKPQVEACQINWRASNLDGDGEKGYSLLRQLFKCLNRSPSEPDQSESILPPPLAVQGSEVDLTGTINALQRISISVPADVVIELAPFASANKSSPDLLNAPRLQQFIWKGAFGILAGNLRRIPLNQLTLLEVESFLTISDALVLLDECQNLVEAALGILQQPSSTSHCHLKPLESPSAVLPVLERLRLATDANLVPFLSQLQAKCLNTLTLEFHGRGHQYMKDAHQLASSYGLPKLEVKAE